MRVSIGRACVRVGDDRLRKDQGHEAVPAEHLPAGRHPGAGSAGRGDEEPRHPEPGDAGRRRVGLRGRPAPADHRDRPARDRRRGALDRRPVHRGEGVPRRFHRHPGHRPRRGPPVGPPARGGAEDPRRGGATVPVTVVRSLVLFVLAALAEIGGAWLVWQGFREHRGLWWIAAGVLALGAYGFVATFQPAPTLGRILAAYGGVFVAGSLAWGVVVDRFRPDRWDYTGAAICLIGVAVIMYAPRR